jgi:hypothetical protein
MMIIGEWPSKILFEGLALSGGLNARNGAIGQIPRQG